MSDKERSGKKSATLLNMLRSDFYTAEVELSWSDAVDEVKDLVQSRLGESRIIRSTKKWQGRKGVVEKWKALWGPIFYSLPPYPCASSRRITACCWALTRIRFQLAHCKMLYLPPEILRGGPVASFLLQFQLRVRLTTRAWCLVFLISASGQQAAWYGCVRTWQRRQGVRQRCWCEFICLGMTLLHCV